MINKDNFRRCLDGVINIVTNSEIIPKLLNQIPKHSVDILVDISAYNNLDNDNFAAHVS